MRISCPNCGAQYEVPDEVIPHDGRDVQCSNCGLTWFQAHPDNPVMAEPEPEPAQAAPQPAPEPAAHAEDWEEDPGEYDEDEVEADIPEAPPVPARAEGRRELDRDVTDILRQEAEHEAELRAAESGLESQPDLGLDDLPSVPAREETTADRLAQLRGEIGDDANGSRRDLLPDIEEINSSLRSEGESTALTPHLAEETAEKPSSNSGFSRGFAVTMVVAALVVVVYANAPEISRQVPQADGLLNALVTLIDKGRLWLDIQVRAFVS